MRTSAFFIVIIGVLSIAATAVAQLPASVKVSTSKLDGERQVQVTPGWLKGDRLLEATPKIGGFWTDKAPTNFMIEAVLVGGGIPERLKIGIDGRVSEFSPTTATPGTTYNQSLQVVETSKRFEVPLAFVQQMVAGTNVVIQVGDGRSFTEAIFSADGPTRARPGFKKAFEKINNPVDAKKTKAAKPPR